MRGATEADAVPAVAQSAAGQPAVEGVAQIGIEDFIKVELRVGEILTAERIPKSDKLLRFTVDLGEAEPRQILAGIAEHYEPEKLVGRKIVVVSNLKPRKLRGFESQGMVLAASAGEEGRPVLATFAEDVPNGTRLK
jgi:methionyl-tRNA synthetase